MSSPRTGFGLIVDVAAPGRSPESAGVLVVDAETGECLQRFRPDLPDLDPENADILEELPEDLAIKARELGGLELLNWLESAASGFIRVSDREVLALEQPADALRWYYHRHIRPTVKKFRTHLPLYALQAAAGRWGPEREVENEPEEWLEAPSWLRRITEDMFVARVVGRSMEPVIPSGSLCIFRAGAAVAGSRTGKRVLVANYGEPGEQRFTVKRYESVRRTVDDERMETTRVILHPLNPEFPSWELDYEPFDLESGRRIQVIAEFVGVLED